VPPGDDDEVVIRGEFEDAISRELDETARHAREAARALDETAVGGEAAAVGMDRAAIAAGRLKRELEGVDRAAEQHRLAQLRLAAAEQEAAKIRQAGVLTASQTARVETMLSTAHRDAKRAAEDLTAAHKGLDRASESLGMRLLRTAGSVGVLEKAFTGIKMVATADIFTSLISGVSSLGAAGVAAAAGLAPLLGLAGGLPALVLAGVSAVGVIGLLTQGLGKAATAISTFGAGSPQAIAALRGMGPASQQAAYDLAGFTGELRMLREEGMREALPYLEGSLNNVRTLLPHVRTGMLSLVDAVGDVAQQGTQRIAGWGDDIDTILSRNAQLVHTLGGSAIDMLDMTRHIMIAAGPMVQDLAEHFAGEMAHINEWMAANPAKMEAFFDRVGTRTLSILHVLGDFAHGIYDIFRGAQPLTDHMGGGIAKSAAEFREWAHSAEGQNSIHKFFTDAIPVVDSMMHLLGQVGHSLATLSHDSNAAGMMNELANALPVLTEMLSLIMKIANTVPGANTVLGLAFLGSRLGISPRLMASGVFGAGRGAFRVGAGMRGAAGANESMAGRMGLRIGSRLGMGAAAAGAGEAGAADLGVASGGLIPLVANPVGAAVAGTAALAIGGYELYEHWKPFRDLINHIGSTLKHDWPEILRAIEIATWPISFPILAIIRHWDGVRQGLMWVWHNALEPIAKFVGTYFVDQFKAVWFVVSKIMDATKWVIDHAKHLPGVGKLESGINWLTGLYTGGPVAPHTPYLVGEAGPELFVSAGSMRVVGGDGAELMSSAAPGFVLPNEALRAITDPRVRDQAARALPVATPVGGGGLTMTATDDGAIDLRYRGGGDGPDLPPIIIGPYNTFESDVDVEAAVARALDRWERERRDRS
jgi:hypothetical protein